MARSNTQQVDVDDLPTEFDDEPVGTSTTAYANGQSMTSTGMDLDALNNLGFNTARDEATRKEITVPGGDWVKTDRWKFSKLVYGGDNLDDDIDPEGRTMFVISGKPDNRTVEGVDYQPQLFVRMSPDKRYKQDDPTKVDTAHKMFLRAKDLYMAIHGAQPANYGQLITMLTEDSYIVRTMVGDNGPIVVEIKAKVMRRR